VSNPPNKPPAPSAGRRQAIPKVTEDANATSVLTVIEPNKLAFNADMRWLALAENTPSPTVDAAELRKAVKPIGPPPTEQELEAERSWGAELFDDGPEGADGYDWTKPSLAIVACDGKGHGTVLFTAGPHVRSFIEEVGTSALGDLGLDDAPHGLSVWEGCIIGGGRDEHTKLSGTFRKLTAQEIVSVTLGQCPWNDAAWRKDFTAPKAVTDAELDEIERRIPDMKTWWATRVRAMVAEIRERRARDRRVAR